MELTEALTSYVAADRRRAPSVNKTRRFYVSDMSKCFRMRWLKRRGIETEFESKVYWTFAMGNMIHEFVYKALESQGLLLEAEDYVGNDHWSGRCDCIVKTKDGRAPVDIKSANEWKFMKVMDGQEDEQTVAQVLTYLLFLREKEENKDMSSGIILYVNKVVKKADQVFFEKKFHLTNWREKKLREEMASLVELWETDKIPPCSCPGWMKNYNAFQPLCQAKPEVIRVVLEYLDNKKRVITTKKAVYLVDGDKRKEILKA